MWVIVCLRWLVAVYHPKQSLWGEFQHLLPRAARAPSLCSAVARARVVRVVGASAWLNRRLDPAAFGSVVWLLFAPGAER